MAHNERCKACKKTVLAMLEKIYGSVKPNYQIVLGTRPEDYAGEAVYPALSRVYSALREHRGYGDFVGIDRIAADFFVPDPGFVVEFDESQHFTQPRLIALENYPDSMQAGYSVPRWQELCVSLDKRDNDPPYRDEQRAWYDTLRDFLPAIKGYLPTVRLYAREMVWCELDPEKPGDVERFRKFLEEKRMCSTLDGPCAPTHEHPDGNWVATVTLETTAGKDPYSNESRMAALLHILSEVGGTMRGDGVLLFPAGWFNTGGARAESISAWVEGTISSALSVIPSEIVVVLGVDGYQDDTGNDRDQIALVIGRNGLVAAARKFFLTDDDRSFGLVPSPSPWTGEMGYPRTFLLNGTKYYLAVCYDIKCRPGNQSEPEGDFDVILNLIHKFELHDGISDFIRKGMGIASRHFKRPVFGAVKFINGYRITDSWRIGSGIFWAFPPGITTGTPGTRVPRMAIDPEAPALSIDLPDEGDSSRALVTIFSRISEKTECMRQTDILYSVNDRVPLKEPKRARKTEWDIPLFLEPFRKTLKPEEQRVVQHIMEWAQSRGLNPEGVGKEHFFPTFPYNGGYHNLISVTTRGRIHIWMKNIKNKPAFSSIEQRKKFAGKMNAINGIWIPEDKLDKQPGFPTTVLTDRQKFDAFTGALDWFLEEVKQSSR